MKIKGWQRLGVVCSVVWIVGGGIYEHFHDFASAKAHAYVLTDGCIQIATPDANDPTAKPPNLMPCFLGEVKWQRMLMVDDTTNMALFAFVPVGFAWLFVYLILFSVRFVLFPASRWVRRGFQE